MKNAMMTIDQAAARIKSGAFLMIAGDEAALTALPRGTWIGGTSVYFVTDTGGREDHEMVFVTEFDAAEAAKTRYCPIELLPTLADNRYDNGASLILIPGFSQAHQEFALDGAGYSGIFDMPLMGWIAGVALDDIGKVSPKVVDGQTGTVHEEGAVLLHVSLPATRRADIDILNIFTQDTSAPKIIFKEDGFSALTAFVDDKEVNFGQWVSEQGLDTKLPLVANYAGAMINVSFQNIDAETGKVDFYAPIVQGAEYRIAKAEGPYAEVFAEQVQGDGSKELSCNCILNYLYGELEGKTTGDFTGPATFGEIAYILLNQTMVRLKTEAQEAAQVA